MLEFLEMSAIRKLRWCKCHAKLWILGGKILLECGTVHETNNCANVLLPTRNLGLRVQSANTFVLSV